MAVPPLAGAPGAAGSGQELARPPQSVPARRVEEDNGTQLCARFARRPRLCAVVRRGAGGVKARPGADRATRQAERRAGGPLRRGCGGAGARCCGAASIAGLLYHTSAGAAAAGAAAAAAYLAMRPAIVHDDVLLNWPARFRQNPRANGPPLPARERERWRLFLSLGLHTGRESPTATRAALPGHRDQDRAAERCNLDFMDSGCRRRGLTSRSSRSPAAVQLDARGTC